MLLLLLLLEANNNQTCEGVKGVQVEERARCLVVDPDGRDAASSGGWQRVLVCVAASQRPLESKATKVQLQREQGGCGTAV